MICWSPSCVRTAGSLSPLVLVSRTKQLYYYNEATGASQWEKPAWLGWIAHDEL